jgi:hypothetical protein
MNFDCQYRTNEVLGIILASDVIWTSETPGHWYLLAGLTRFFEKIILEKKEKRFVLEPRIALNYHYGEYYQRRCFRRV